MPVKFGSLQILYVLYQPRKIDIFFSIARYRFSMRNNKVYKIYQRYRLIFFTFYNVLQPNFINFRMPINTVVNFTRLNLKKKLSIMQLVYWQLLKMMLFDLLQLLPH